MAVTSTVIEINSGGLYRQDSWSLHCSRGASQQTNKSMGKMAIIRMKMSSKCFSIQIILEWFGNDW